MSIDPDLQKYLDAKFSHVFDMIAADAKLAVERDRRYGQQFVDNQKAVEAALSAAEKARAIAACN